LFYLAEKSGGNAENLFEILLVSECCLLPCLSLAAVLAAIVGLVGAKRHPGNRKAAVWAIVLTLLSVAGFLVPIIIFLSHMTLQIG
jgi:exosortase/archaeosortase